MGMVRLIQLQHQSLDAYDGYRVAGTQFVRQLDVAAKRVRA
jgi:hypothetical protein